VGLSAFCWRRRKAGGTDGGVCLISTVAVEGSAPATVIEIKVFNAQDGQGLSLAHTMGIQTGFITGRNSPAVAQRARELKVQFVYLGQAKKTQAFEECIEKSGVTEEEVAYMGDDLPDTFASRHSSQDLHSRSRRVRGRVGRVAEWAVKRQIFFREDCP
jgi:YrbI family 3-deoxy-D-manno-octulosonate 8-phosphate phosphatase